MALFYLMTTGWILISPAYLCKIQSINSSMNGVLFRRGADKKGWLNETVANTARVISAVFFNLLCVSKCTIFFIDWLNSHIS